LFFLFCQLNPALLWFSSAQKHYDVIVIGAGIAGVATAKNLLQDGHSVLVIEGTDHVGGLWQFTEDGYGVTSFTHINVSKHNYCFSDYPFPEDTPDFPSHAQMSKYINDYVDHFKVRDHILFKTRVTKLQKVVNSRYLFIILLISKP